jgi:hypothetical protein
MAAVEVRVAAAKLGERLLEEQHPELAALGLCVEQLASGLFDG